MSKWIGSCIVASCLMLLGGEIKAAKTYREDGGTETLFEDKIGKLPLVPDVATKENTVTYPMQESSARSTMPGGNVSRQPQGALTGRFLFINGGHGYAYGGPWRFGRGLTNGMVEDTGNVDQMTLFAYQAFNAGATVIPFRPIGNQTNEVIVDNTSPSCEFFGTWSTSSANRYYGTNAESANRYRFTNSSLTETAFVRYTPTITVRGYYPVYTWAKNSPDQIKDQLYKINHTGGTTEVRINHKYVGCGWIYLGSYYFDAGTAGNVEITNESSENGIVVADAIRFGNGMGSIVRSTVSGVSKEDEASRYWIQGTMTNTYSTDTSVYDGTSGDESDNVNAPPYMAAYMNDVTQGSKTDRLLISFHSNAQGDISPYFRGSDGLWNNETVLSSSYAGTKTPNQQRLAHLLGEAVNTDIFNLRNLTEVAWIDRPVHDLFRKDYAFGEIRWDRIKQEMDATILEVAYHDNANDAALMLDPKVRSWIGRSTVKGAVRYFNEFASGSLAFSPDSPHSVMAQSTGGGNARIQWSAAESNSATGDPATGYNVYRSSNGYGFGNPVHVDGVTNTTFDTTVSDNEITYFRVTATNPGGESLPGEVVAVFPGTGTNRMVIVNGFDRLDRTLNPTETLGGITMNRVKPWKSNSFDYVVQHAKALQAAGKSFDTISKNMLSGSIVSPYECIVWIAGNQSTKDKTLTDAQQTILSDYLNSGKKLFLSGSDVAYDLNLTVNGKSFLQNHLGAQFAASNSAVNTVAPVSSNALNLSANLSFGVPVVLHNTEFPPQNNSPYSVKEPDVINAASTSTDKTLLTYVGGTYNGRTAAVSHDAGNSKTIFLAFPFESIATESARIEVMRKSMTYLTGESSSVNLWSIY